MGQRPRNTPLYVIAGLIVLFFVVPFVLALIASIAAGELTFPTELIGGAATEFDVHFLLAVLITALPLLLVLAVEANRRRGGSQKKSLTLTLGLLIVLMIAMTAVPLLGAIQPLSDLAPRHALAIIALTALPLILVTFLAAILLPGLWREKKDGDEVNPEPEENGEPLDQPG